MLWIGERTRGVDDAHVHFLGDCSKNPVGVKIGSDGSSDDILKLSDALNPQNEAGKLLMLLLEWVLIK